VLGTPPAFNLSQDQTLHLKISRIIKQEWIQNGSNLLLDILVTRSFAKGFETRVPTQITYPNF
jgi:hypothetical protein